MSGKNKGGRETRKPKQEQNKKAKGQTPPPTGSMEAATASKSPGRK
jgi:hypothetical protein